MKFSGFQRFTQFRDDDSGSGVLEFALAAIVLLTIIFGVMDASRAMYADHYVSNAAREATRYAMVRGQDFSGTACATAASYSCMATSADITNFVNSITPLGFTANNLSVASSWSGTALNGSVCTASNPAQGCVVNVQVSYTFNFVLPFLPKNSMVLSSTSGVTVLQ